MDMNNMKGKVDQMLEARLAQSKNNFQHGVAENVGSSSGFIVITNPMYDPLSDYNPPQVNIPTQSQLMPLTNPDVERLHALEERVRAMDVNENFRLDMCLVPGLVIPPKFKLPNFEKYKGDTCPRHHLVMFFRKMESHTHDDKLMIHCFQDSLIGASLSWYMKLKRSYIQSREDLANSFLKQYNYNLDMDPYRRQLQSLSQKNDESFKGYAQRWREFAAQVQPPLLDKELVDLFMDTLPSTYFERMVGNGLSYFAHLVTIGERIESALKSGRIQGASSSQASETKSLSNSQKEEEDETNAIIIYVRYSHDAPAKPYDSSSSQQSPFPTPFYPYRQSTTPKAPYQQPWSAPYANQRSRGRGYQNQPSNQSRPQNNMERRNSPLDPIPMSCSQLLPYLIQRSLADPKSLKPLPEPCPPRYDPDVQCGYHAGSIGHSTEDCNAFKAKGQQLIDKKYISFPDGNMLVHVNLSPK
ncbi:uncharacterized protein LOC127129870 [Lathyrus oleraceus]|uniref:uncharacterized protein LOC127129870 n=1 Tax=Pisum sativum TaxID=3888 RepID=UPI0021CE53D7|nr:uncharacterized protein LOC127129870 [Pisum sativum]